MINIVFLKKIGLFDIYTFRGGNGEKFFIW